MEKKKDEDEDQQSSMTHLECISDVSQKPVGGLLGRLRMSDVDAVLFF